MFPLFSIACLDCETNRSCCLICCGHFAAAFFLRAKEIDNNLQLFLSASGESASGADQQPLYFQTIAAARLILHVLWWMPVNGHIC